MALKLPRPLARRQRLYGSHASREELVRLGHAYLQKDLVFDAADFFCEARDRDGLEVVKDRARRMGDAFLLRQIQMAAPDLVSKSDWDELSRRAGELGKGIYADRAAAGGAPPPPPLQGEDEPEAAAEKGAGGEAPEKAPAATAGERGRDDEVDKGDARKRHGGAGSGPAGDAASSGRQRRPGQPRRPGRGRRRRR